MDESESSTFEAKFKPSVAIVWIENTLPYPGNERSAAPIEKDVGSANQSNPCRGPYRRQGGHV